MPPLTDAWRTPLRLPFALDSAGDRLGYVCVDEAAYLEASFLDGRILEPGTGPLWAPWDEVLAATRDLPAACDFIFHIGHVGSTLVSRLLGQSAGLFVLREPAVLRELVRAGAPAKPAGLDAILRLVSRTWRPDQRSLVKATSFVSQLGRAMMEATPGSRALLMFSAPQVHMAGLLAGENSRQEMIVMAPSRAARVELRLGASVQTGLLSPGEMAAMTWACEILALSDLARGVPGRVVWLDFDRFLAQPRAGLTAILTHLRGCADEMDVEAMMVSSDFGRYAKDRSYAFDPAFRQRVLTAARHDYGEEIDKGLAWLNALGSSHPDFAQAAMRAATSRIP